MLWLFRPLEGFKTPDGINRGAGARDGALRFPAVALGALLAFSAAQGGGLAMEVVAVDSPSPLIEIKVMVKSGSISDPPGKEGLAYLTARLLLEGSFGDPKRPVTKEKLAEITRPWGERALPRVQVEKETTTFSITVPRDVFPSFIKQVFVPLFRQPLFAEAELERIRNEALVQITTLRYENIEMLGLEALDNFIFEGTSYSHLAIGSAAGLKKIGRQDVIDFYNANYFADNLIIGLSTSDKQVERSLVEALSGLGGARAGPPAKHPVPPASFQGRHLVIVSQPNAESTGIHAGFPIPVTQKDPDYWPLYVANTWFGAHRDSFSHLFQEIRQKRGYNYGDYSYIEHFPSRPSFLFRPFNAPRHHQYFSIWLRPVSHQYAHHLLKALTWELEHFIENGLTDEQVRSAKNKAKVIYLNLAETISRMLESKVDDKFYRDQKGYLEQYISAIESVTAEQVNAAIRKYLQTANIKYVVVTDDSVAEKLAEDIAANRNDAGKSLSEYGLEAVEREDVGKAYIIPQDKLDILLQDALWRSYRLRIPRENIRVVPVEKLFETGGFVK